MYNKEKHFPEDNTIFIYVFTPVGRSILIRKTLIAVSYTHLTLPTKA